MDKLSATVITSWESTYPVEPSKIKLVTSWYSVGSLLPTNWGRVENVFSPLIVSSPVLWTTFVSTA